MKKIIDTPQLTIREKKSILNTDFEIIRKER